MRTAFYVLGALCALVSLFGVDALPYDNLFGTQHFQPCYFINDSVPCLLDGALAADALLQSKIFKFALKANTPQMYPFNNRGQFAWPSRFDSLTDIARTTQVDALLRNSFGTKYSVFVIWAYTVGLPDSYWCNGISAEQMMLETQQFRDLTSYLLQTYQGLEIEIYLEHWEGDWAARCGSYDRGVPPDPQVSRNMIQWLSARQAGVEQGRASAPAGCKCHVYHGTEVNLVLDSIHNASFGNIIRSVVPHVRLDTVSYSSYEAQGSALLLTSALDFIFSSMNRSAASPPKPVFITEWGLPLNQVDPSAANYVAETVVNVTKEKSTSYLRMALHWQVINNELTAGGDCGSEPVADPALQRGFWEILPSGKPSSIGLYLKDVIAGNEYMGTYANSIKRN